MERAHKSKLVASINYDLRYIDFDKVAGKEFEEIFELLFDEWKYYSLEETTEGYTYFDKKLREQTLVDEELYKYCIERYRASLDKRLASLKELIPSESKGQEKASEGQVEDNSNVIRIIDYINSENVNNLEYSNYKDS